MRNSLKETLKYLSEALDSDRETSSRASSFAKSSLSNLRSDEEFMKLVNEAQHISKENDLIEIEFKEISIKKKKRMSGEVGQDEHQSSASYYYKTMVYFTVLDSVITSISNRFNESKEVLKDLSSLSPTRMMSFGKEKNLNIPIGAFQELYKWLPKLDKTTLKNKYILFSKSIHALIDGMSQNTLQKNKISSISDIYSNS
jgi:hypothetical protein